MDGREADRRSGSGCPGCGCSAGTSRSREWSAGNAYATPIFLNSSFGSSPAPGPRCWPRQGAVGVVNLFPVQRAPYCICLTALIVMVAIGQSSSLSCIRRLFFAHHRTGGDGGFLETPGPVAWICYGCVSLRHSPLFRRPTAVCGSRSCFPERRRASRVVGPRNRTYGTIAQATATISACTTKNALKTR